MVSDVRRMNEVNPRRARLVLGPVTVFGRVYHLGMYVCVYVCMYVIFIRCDKRTSNKHKKQSQNDVQYKAAKPKTISLYKAI